MADYIRDLLPTKRGSGVSLHGSNPEPLMSALGQKQTLQSVKPMSALPPKTDIGTQSRHVRYVPEADICTATKIPISSPYWPATSSVCGTAQRLGGLNRRQAR